MADNSEQATLDRYGVAAERPEGDSGWYLAVGSTRCRGHRFTWGQQLPSPEGGKLGERGFAVDDPAKLRGRDGSQLPPPSLARATEGQQPAAHDTGAATPGESSIETTSSAGVRSEGTTSATGQDTDAVNDSQSGSTRRVRK